MTATVIYLRDYDWVPPRARVRGEGSAEVVILPVVRVDRRDEGEVLVRRGRQSLLGWPPGSMLGDPA